MDDDRLLDRAERALTEIKVNQGLTEEHAAVLAALRIRLKGTDGSSLDALLEAAGEAGAGDLGEELEAAEPERERRPSLDDLLAQEPKPKRDWPA